MKVKNIEPARQGDLDSLCGFYSIVNMMYWFYGKRIRRKILFNVLINYFSDHWPVRECLTMGIDSSQMDILLNFLKQGRYSKYPVNITQPFRIKRPNNKVGILRDFRKYLASGHERVILVGDQFHWSVVTGIDKDNFYFFDSCNYRVAPHSNYSLRKQIGKIQLYPEGIYFIEK
ncbi:hypothetical protein B6O77_000868 [Salmonella enterica subsp. enterica serovar Mississippi]|nr:hypothetical protein [Salmonella enterica subsp. enterica serovar Mississippi]